MQNWGSASAPCAPVPSCRIRRRQCFGKAATTLCTVEESIIILPVLNTRQREQSRNEMSSSSTPKRIFGSVEDVTQSETTDSQLKRTRIDGSFISGSDSEVCWAAPCGSFRSFSCHTQSVTDARGTEDSGVQSAVPLLQPHRSTCELLLLSVTIRDFLSNPGRAF